MKVLAIIPGRGGSKGILKKNIKLFLGAPLISYSIRLALKCSAVSKTVVTSDNDEIIEISKSFGVSVIKRPDFLATDKSLITPVIEHALNFCEKEENVQYDAILLLQPTSPLRTIKQIETAIEFLKKDSTISSVISVCEMDDVHPARMYTLNSNEQLEPFIPDYETTRRQEIPKAYYRNGAIYLVKKSSFQEQKTVMAKPIKPLIVSKEFLPNIDDDIDWLFAETMAKKINLNENL